jgi:hypothetical protein
MLVELLYKIRPTNIADIEQREGICVKLPGVKNKPIEDSWHKRSRNGFARLCKACRNLSLTKNRKPQLFVGETERECIACGEIKPFALFKKDSRKSNGVGSRCKDCNSKNGEPIPHKAFHRLKAKQKLYNIEIETTKEEITQIFNVFESRYL